MQRIEYVFQSILELLPETAKSDFRYTAVKTIMRESIKDLEMIPDETIVPMMRQFAQAIAFIADGDMADVEVENDGPE
jgi:hypothetical protein